MIYTINFNMIIINGIIQITFQVLVSITNINHKFFISLVSIVSIELLIISYASSDCQFRFFVLDLLLLYAFILKNNSLFEKVQRYKEVYRRHKIH